jgi:hypothetical protein
MSPRKRLAVYRLTGVAAALPVLPAAAGLLILRPCE